MILYMNYLKMNSLEYRNNIYLFRWQSGLNNKFQNPKPKKQGINNNKSGI
jgi:hypothetical protein